MKRIIAIDIPWVALMGAGSENHLLETLDAMQQNGCFLLVGENLYDALPEATWENELVVDLTSKWLTQLQTMTYGRDTFSPYISHNPDMTDESFGEKINDEIKALYCALHADTKLEHAVLVIDRAGWETYEQLVTTKDKKTKRHTLIHASVQSLDAWLQARQPRLVVEKHFAEEYERGNKVVSSFKAGVNAGYAAKLLSQAYCEYEGMEDEPKYLYTYDAQNGCFVEFRGDRNFEYHGMDLKDNAVQEVVPEYIRKKYHK